MQFPRVYGDEFPSQKYLRACNIPSNKEHLGAKKGQKRLKKEHFRPKRNKPGTQKPPVYTYGWFASLNLAEYRQSLRSIDYRRIEEHTGN